MMALPSASGALTVKFAGHEGLIACDNLYIAGLPSPGLDQESLRQLFEEFGFTVVRCKAIPDTRGHGTSAAMVQLASVEEARAAIATLHGQTLESLQQLGPAELQAPAKPSRLIIPQRPALARNVVMKRGFSELDPSQGKLTVKYSGQSGTPSDNLYISGLPSPQIDQASLHEMFTGLGLTVVRSRVIPDAKGVGSSAAMVQLASTEEASTAIMSWHGQPCVEEAHIPQHHMQSLQQLTPAQPTLKRPKMSRTDPAMTIAIKYAGDGNMPSDNLYISGLPSPVVDEDVLQGLFTDMGFTIVRSRVIPDTKGTGSSAALVQLASKEEAASAIAQLNGATLDGYHGAAKVAPAPRQGWAVSSTLSVKYAGDSGTPSDNLYVSGLPSQQTSQESLNDMFTDMGYMVVRSRLLPDTRGVGVCTAMVQLASVDEATSAITALSGRPVSVAAMNESETGVAPQPSIVANWHVKFAGNGHTPSDNLYISGLPAPVMDQETLLEIFSSLGLNVVRSRVIPDSRGIGSSAAMVQLCSVEEATYAIATLNEPAVSASSPTLSQSSPRGLGKGCKTGGLKVMPRAHSTVADEAGAEDMVHGWEENLYDDNGYMGHVEFDC